MDTNIEAQAAEVKASIARMDGEVLAAINRRDFTAADKLDRQRSALQRMLAAYHEGEAKSIEKTLARTGNANCRSYITMHRAEARRLRAAAAS